MNTKEERKSGLLQKLRGEAMNRRQIKDIMFCTQQTADEYIAELKAEKKIYIAYYVRTSGMPSPYYLAGNNADAPKPKRLTNAEYTANYEKRKAENPLNVRPSAKSVNNQHLISGCFSSMVRDANVSPTIELSD